ncbi:tandem-95 repeat protein [Vibrio lentus]|uniref:tandem-95 repeat protein n=1 Tax=Vibrio lentus TaxID=136468 RepID=UPI00246848E7|nr:tandem-95 repeat protein [Vibrio lentus]MDH5925794.1 tandem-95 repeat protein [Vibrio lentus]
MAGENNQNNQNEDLNDAVEQTDTNDAGTPSQQQNQQNQQNTIASTVATGAENTDAVDEVNQALEDNPSGAGNTDEASASGGAVQEDSPESSEGSDAEQSNVVDSVASGSGEGAGGGASNSGAGAQAVGGENAAGSGGSSNAEGNNEQGEAARTAAASNSSSSESDSQQVDDDLDSQTVEETFAVDVQASDEETISEVEDDFDSETTSETFKIKVESENDAPEAEQDLAYIMDEDGSITFTQEQLLEYTSDVDGDELVASNVQVGADATVQDNGDGTFTVVPSADFNGELDLTFDISDGQETISSAIDLTVRPINDAPVPEDKTFEIEEDGTLVFTDADLLTGATDIEGDNLTVEGVTYDGGDGILTDNGNGTYTFAPNENFNGDVNFSFDVSDGTDTVAANIDVSVTAVDDAPVSGDLAYSVDEDGSIRLSQEQLLSQASDVEGDDLTASGLTVGGDATVTQNDDGSFTITPDENFNGDIDISFDISDGTNTVQASADLTVNPINDLPVPQDQQFSVEEDGTLIFTDADLLTGATDIEGDNLSVQGVTYDGGDGILTDNGNGTYTFAPNENFNGDVNFSFDVSDGTDTVSANIDVSVTSVDDAPVSGDLAYSVDEDGSIRLSQEQLLSQASDVEGDDLTASSLTVDGDATVTQNNDGSFTITPNENFNGDIGISFDISDGTNTVQASADLTVNPINDLPVPQDQQFSVEEDGTLIFTDADLLTGATDIEGDNLTVEGVTYDGGDGILTDNGNGTYTFAPNENFNGDVNFSFDVSDGTDTVAANIDVSVTAVDDAPVSGDLAYSVDEDGSIRLSQEQLLSQASDVEGDDLTASGLTVGGDATVIQNDDGSFTITPDENFNGDIDISFDISDGTNTVQASADLIVNPINDLPVPQDQQFSIEEDGTLQFTDADLLTGATDIEGDDLTVEGISYEGTDGVLTDHGDGSYSFAPNENFNGDVNFSFDVSDGTDTVSANIDVSVTPENDPPVAGSTSYTVNEDNSITISDAQLLATSSDIEGDVSIDSVTYSGSDGVLEINGNGTYTFSPNENFNGEIALDVVVADEEGATDATTAGITVLEVNDPPVAGPTSYTIDEDSVLTFSESQVLLNASDVEGDVELVGISYDGPGGIFSVNGDGTCSFAPNENFNGQVQLDVTIRDEDGAEVDTVINVDVLPINDAPVSGNLAYNVNEDGSITLSQDQLLSQASDVEGEDLTASDLTVDGNATVTADDDGSFTIVPDANFNGDVDIQFNITDGTDTVQATADLTVNPVNDLPVPQDQQFSIEEDGTLQFTDADLLTGATDIDSDDLTVEGISYTGGDGVLTDHGDGTYTFAPNENFNGDVNFSFDVSDGTETVSANIDVSVTPENDPPVAGSTSYMVNEDNAITISDEQLLANSSDVEGAVSVDSVTYSGTDGVFQDNGDGSYTFLPNENFSGDISLDVIVADEDGSIDETTAGITVLEVNDPPVAGPTSYTIDEDSVLTFSESQILVNASDVEGDVELVGINYDGEDGIFTVNGDGTCSFAPNENFNGQVQLGVTIQDEDGATVETLINVDVLPINDPPVSGDLAYTINEDSSITLSQDQLLARAGDIDSENLEAINLSTDENATIQQNDDGSYTITPDADYNGDLDLSFDIIDNDGGEVQVGLDITVNPLNDLPQAQDQQFTIEEDGTLLFTDADLLAGASDIDGDELSIENVLYTGADGVLSDNGDGTYSFAPNENFNGDVQFSFDVSDGTGSTAAHIDVSVTPENDPPVAGSTAYTVQEDGQITISDEQLLANSSDVEGDVALSSVSYTGDDGSFVDNGNGTYTFTPNENFDGDISLDVVVVDEDGATATTTAGIDVIAVNDGPETSGIQAEVDEDNSITITQEQLLANASDVEGDELTASNLQTNDPDATIVANDDGSFTITHTENFNGELDFTYSISDGDNEVLTTLDLTVNPVNDAPEAGEEIFIQAQEDQTVGVTLREEPALRLDQAPENGIIEANLDNEWVVLEVGQEVPADTEVRFVPSEDALAEGTHTTQIGTFDDNASVDDWGTEVDPYTREFSDGDLTVTVQSNDDPLGAWNGNTHIGHGIGDTDRQGLSGDEKLTISVEGQDINEISFHLDGLGGWFMEESRHFTEVEIRAFNEDGDMIDSMTYHKEDRGTFETDYTLTVDQPVSYFELGTVQGNGTYVVQNMTVSQTCHDEAVFTSIGVDGSEITETVELNIHAGDNEIELTADLPNITIDTEGSAQFASVVITEEQLLAQASDIDGDDLDIQNLELVGENSEHATLTDNGDGTWTVTPDENFYGEIELGYQVSDGELTDDNIININFESVNDAPIVSGPMVLSTDEDQGITFSAEDLLSNTTDVEGDALSISDITYGGDDGDLVDNGDGTFTFMPNENFNGEIDIDYKVFDGTDEVATHLDLTVVPVNDVPVPGEPLHTQMLENGSMIIEAKDLLSGATDVDGDILHVENLLLADQTQGTLTDNGDNTFTFEPAEDFYGEVNLTFDISDGQASAPSTARVDVEIVNEGPEVSGPIEAAVDEDGSITITQEDLLANATDVDGDNLEAVNFATNDPNAVVVENPDGSFTITPSADFFGEIEFTYDVTDAIETVAADLNLTVNPINDAPDVPDMSFTTEDGQAITITEAELLAQATDVEGDELSVLNVTSASDTVDVTDNGDGTYTLTPEQGFFGNVDLTFDVSDGTDVVAANIDLKVEFVNDAPEAAPMVADVDEDGSILVTQAMLLENASDQDGDELFASALETNDPNASIVDNGDGTYTVTPSENFNGDIAFTYEVSDGELSTANDMTLTVNPVNDIPIVAPGMYHIEEDGSILFTQEDLLSGAIDIDGDDLSVTSINYSGDEGTVTDNGDGTFSFVPEEHFSGDLQFSFTVTDGTDEVEQDLSVHIEAVADAPDLVITDGDGVNVDDQAILVEPGGIVELNIAAALVDQDLSETLTVTVDGVPEGSVIQYDNEGVLNDQENGITSYNDTEITVTFEGETAGYQNAAGYYKVDEDGNITGVEVVYENASQVGGGGDLVPGQDQFSFQVEEGESFNLFLIPNGHQHNDFDAMQDGQYEFRAADGSPANMDTVDPQLVFVAADGTETVVQGQNGDAIFHGGSSSQLNQDGIEHTRTTVNEDGELVYGFEDLYGGGDADYSDFNFTIDVGEVNSQIYSGEVTVGPDGTVNLPTTAIENALQIQLPEDFNEQLEVHVTATATELSNDDSETVSQTIYINATGAHIEHAPEALPVAATVEEDGSIIITQEDLLANARDLDGDQLTALNLATDDDSVTITDNGDGTYTLTPDADFNGDVSFTFDVSDGDDVVSTNLELTVSPVNDGPEAQDQAFTVNEDGVLTFTDQDLLTGSTDIEGDDLSVEGVTYTGADGVLTDNGDGTYSFAPNENFNGDVNFSFNVSDGTDTVTANIDVSVTPENDPPVAGSTSYTVHEDNSITISNEQLLANSSDIEGEVAIDSVTYSGSDGVLEINGDGTYTFSPNENFNGEVSLDVVVVDEDDAAVSTTAGITVLEVNDPPVAGPTSYTIDEDSVLTFNESQVLLNASDIEGDVQLVEINYDGPDGIFSINGDGTCSFAPNENFNGQVQLDVTIQDEDGAQVDTHITVDVLPINDVPVSGDLAYSVEEDGSITLSQEQLLSQASDVDGDDLTASNLVVDGDATVVVNDDGSFTITPDANFNGDIDLTFDISDGTDTLVATADLTVNPVNDLPQPQDQTFSIGEDGILNFTDEDLLTGATDIDGDDLSVEGVTYTGADGVLTDNGDGSYSFAPNENFNGDVNFSFDVSDGTDTVQANIDVSVTPENDPPVAGSTSYTVHEDNSITISDEQLLANSSDIEDEVAVDSVTYTGADGVFEDNGDGTYTFSPNENFNGEVSLDVVVTDEEGATEATTAGITVLEVNDPPIAGSTSYSVNEDEVITISSEQLLANASDIEGEVAIDSVNYTGADGIFTDNGDGTFSFAPNANFDGDVSLDVVVTDEDGATVATNASIDVLPVNDAPVSGDLAYSVDEDGSITLSQEQLLAQASDVDGDDLTAANLTVGGDATVTANDDGSFTITPDANFNGDIDLNFDITDGDATVQATADLTVNPVNDLPTVGEPQFVTQEDTSFTFTEEQLLQNAGDIDGDNLSVENVASDSGSLVDNGDGTYTFAPNENFDGNVNVTFDVNDGTATVPAEATIDVQSVVDMPELSIASDLVIASDNFESGSNGWNTGTESSQGFESGDMLGRIGGTGGDEAVSKTYDIPSDVSEVNISFSFYEIDSWDGESFQIFVGGEELTSLDNSAFQTQDGTTTLYDSAGNEVGEVVHGVSQGEGFSGWNDQAHQINLTVPVEDGQLELGFGSTLNQGVSDESFGIDNIEITVSDADYQIIGTEDTPVPLDIDAALTDTDGSENLAILIEDVPEGSSLSAGTDNGDGKWSLQPEELAGLEFIPSGDFNGDVVLTVNATSTDVDTGTTATATQDVTIHISPANDAPEAEGDISAVTAEDNSITLTQEQLLEHAIDIDGDDLSAINLTTSDENATVEMNDDGSFTITPSENFNGNIEFSYDVTDGEDMVAAGLDLTVTPVNDAPESQDQAFTIGEDGVLNFTDADLLTGATDVEGDDLTVEGVTYTGADGVLTDNGDGSYSFAPNENFNGDVNFSFDVSDGTDTVQANIDVSVTPENDPPVAGSTSYTVHEDNSITISNEQLLANSSDIEGEVAIDSVTYTGSDGVFEDNGDGTYTFSPNENFNGDVSLAVVVTDEEGATEATTAGITVLEVNDPPIAGSTSYSVNEDEVITISAEQLLASSSDIEGEVAIDSVNYTGADGIFTDNGDGTFSFAPNANFDGDVNLDVVVTDEDGATTATTASIDVLPINDPPVSGDLAYSIDEDGSITLTQEQLLSQASDVDGDDLTASNLSAGDNASVVDNGDGTFTVTPDANFNGDIDLSFDVSDGTESIVANADLTVNPVNDLPTTSDVYANVDEDNVITITQEQLLANAADIEGDDLVASDLTLVGDDATIVDNGDGTFSITPSENFNGYIDVAYSISDGDTPIAANLGLTVDPVNDAPIVSADVAITIEEDGSYTITQEELLQFATDIEDDDMTAIIGEPGDETTVTGTVLDAETGNPIAGADVTLTDNAGHSYTAVTDQSGNYSVSGPVVDQGTVTIEQEGSITSSFLVPAGEDTNGGVTAISEVLEETDMRIVVTWGESPRDMDNHLWLYDTENGNELDHIYYRDMSHDLGEGNVVQQDVDDTNGGGPETITIPNYQDADMHYSVHNYTSRSWDVDGVEDVQVQVFVGDTLVETFSPDLSENPSGDHWHVFDIVNGVIVPSQDVGTQNAFDLPTAEEALANENGIDISELLTGDEGDGSGETGGNEPSVGDVSIENALITDNGDGTYTITPEENFNGEFSISYNVDDGNGGVTPAELDVTVTAVNDLSVIYDHDYTINEDGSLTFTDEQLLAGATDIDGDDLSVESVNYEGTEGVFTDNGDGTYTFAPNENFNGSVDLTYDVSDGTDVVSANIDVQVVPINDVPVAGTTAYSVEEDGSITLSDAQLLANSSDVEGEVFVSDVSYSGTDGVFTDNGDGTYTFSPNENFNGDISLDVSVMDEDGATAETTAGIDVIAVNDLPVAGSTTYSVDEDSVITISDAQLLANSSDIEGDVSVSDVSYSGADGIFTDNGDGTYSFAPNENFNGNVSLDVIVADEEGATAETTAGIEVIAVNDAPVSGDLAYSVDEDGSITLSQEQLLAQASDVDGDVLTAANLSAGDNATVTANDDGSFTITPDADFNGDIDLSFDLSDGTETVVATADLTVNPVNDIAVVEDVAYTIEEDGSLTFTDEQLLAGASDIDGDELSVADVSYTGAEGVFTDNGDGTYTFAPNENFNGDVSLDFSVSDGTETVGANIDVTVTDVNDAPVAGATSYQMNEDGTITLSPEQLIANSSDVDGEVSLDSVSYSGADGILVQNEDGSVTFAPNENFNGDINLDVTVIDDDGATAQTTAGIEVIAVNDAPVAGNVAYSVDEDGSITLSQEQLLANASDVDGDALIASNLSAGDNATVTANDDGSFTITPDADFNGDIDLSFDVSDGLETVQAGVDLTVNPVNDLPTAADQSFTVEEDGTLIFTDADLLAGAADIDGDDLSITDVSYTGAEGVFTDNGDGTYSFAPNENFNGDVNLGFTVFDGTETVDANIDVTVTDVNDAPVAGSTSYQMNEDGTITISPEQLIANSSDVDGEVSLESVTYTGSDGALVQNDDGSVTFTPSENFNGDISLDVVVTDDDGATATTTAGIEVLAVNDGPESEDVKLTTAEDSTILITQDMLLAQATDIDNTADELSASGLQIDPSLGELLDNEDGTWSFTPNENFNGDVPMTFNVSDGQETISVDGNIDVTPVNDAPEAPMIEMQGEEDVVMVIDPAYIADQVTDLDGDEISIESITVRAPANATLTQQPDGMYHLVTTQDFNGLVELGYQATDGEEVVDGSLNVDVIPVNDAPFNVGNAMMTTNEDGAFTFDAGDLMNLFGDIDTADLVVSRIITADGEDGGEVTDNGDGTWTFTPTGDFAGVSDLQVVVSDGEFETVLDVPVYVRPVADGAVISTDHDGPLVFGEDETGHLGLNVGLVDDSETLSNLVMTGFPVGFEVTDGVNTVMITEPGQYIDLFDWDISNIQMTPPEDFYGEFFVTVSATTVDYGDEPEAFEDGIDSGDFETVAGDSIILTADDLIGLAENVDADSDDEVKLVHLADRSQGEIVDNGDGTWTFTPAPGFTGEADIAYVVDKDGVLHDEQTGVVVKEGDSQENAAPEVNSITTTEIAADATLSFTDEDMLANLTDAEGDSLSIESVSLMEGQGVIESDNQGNYQFTPAEDYTGDVQVGFIATDGENRIESFFNVDIQGGDEAAASEGYALADDGSLTITESQLVDELGVSDSAQVVDVADANDAGFFAESGEGEWTYWPNEDFDGNLAMNVDVNDGGEVSSHSLSIQVADDSVQSDEPQVQAAQATEEQQVEVAQQADDQAQDTETEDSVADVTAAPGDTISISIPDEVSGNESVDYAEMSGLPEGSTVSNALDNGDGSFTISGNLDQSVSVELPEGYEGTSEIQFQGYDELGGSIDGASGSVEVEVDDQYTMQGSTQEQQPDMAGMESGGSDWTSSGGQDQGVDFTDDSGSFDSDSQTGTDQGNDFDQSSI